MLTVIIITIRYCAWHIPQVWEETYDMRLHEDKDAFPASCLETVHEQTGYRTDVLEKDYYVLLILQELAVFQADGLPAFFKGGTALYKALKTTNRFSEDIDLSVDTRRGCSRTQNDKRLERAAKEVRFPTRGMRRKGERPARR